MVLLESEGVTLASLVETARVHADVALATPMRGSESTHSPIVQPLLAPVAL